MVVWLHHLRAVHGEDAFLCQYVPEAGTTDLVPTGAVPEGDASGVEGTVELDVAEES